MRPVDQLTQKGEPIEPWSLAELGCWTTVVLAPILTWVNGPAVSADQNVGRAIFFGGTLAVGSVLRIARIVRRKERKNAFSLSRRNGGNALVAALLALHAAMLAWGAWRQSPTIDEFVYLPAGVSHWQLGDFGLCKVSPPLVRLVAALPVLLCQPVTDWTVYPTQEPSPTFRADFPAGRRFLEANGSRVLRYFSLGRCACIPFSLLGAWLCCSFATELFGRAAGILAMADLVLFAEHHRTRAVGHAGLRRRRAGLGCGIFLLAVATRSGLDTRRYCGPRARTCPVGEKHLDYSPRALARRLAGMEVHFVAVGVLAGKAPWVDAGVGGAPGGLVRAQSGLSFSRHIPALGPVRIHEHHASRFRCGRRRHVG